uniref:Uncharacterized protein MANES_14G016000 n=1 Tax=Rhizophora mucronata TaxID=61149 RepID=A0A2P2K5T7_RHIMU
MSLPIRSHKLYIAIKNKCILAMQSIGPLNCVIQYLQIRIQLKIDSVRRCIRNKSIAWSMSSINNFLLLSCPSCFGFSNSSSRGNNWTPPAARSAETVLDPSEAAFEL